MPQRRPVVVFLSHSHRDRHTATTLQMVLESNGAQTYLDQDQIQAGDTLPARVRSGIESSDMVLLLWSYAADRSSWVQREWEAALDLRKKIIPYKLDATALPPALDDRVFVELDDQARANAGLLRAVFGAGFKPAERTALFPGKWLAQLAIAGFGSSTYDIELRTNGQVEGVAQIQPAGILGDAARQFGFGHVLSTKIPVHGEWAYEDRADLLTVTLTAVGFGAVQTETIKIRATGRERGAIQGEDLGGRTWTLTQVQPTNVRVGSSDPKMQQWYESMKAQVHKRAVHEVVLRGVVGAMAKNAGAPLSMTELNDWGFDELSGWLADRGFIRLDE
jgi:hypothetical protein